MKRYLNFLLTFVIALTMMVIPLSTCTTVQAASYPFTATVTRSGGVVMRSRASSKSKKIVKIPRKASVTVTGKRGSWYAVKYNSKKGYVPVSSVKKASSSTASTPAVPLVTQGTNGYTICIDAGHQLHQNKAKEPIGPGSSKKKKKVSSGTAGTKTRVPEYALNLSVALKLREELISRGYTVVMIRTTNDVDISNAQRAKIANSYHADAFIRIHANGTSSSHSVHGMSTMCQKANNPYNGSIYNSCYQLSQCVLKETVAATGAYSRGVKKTNNLTGINWSKVPVTLIEMGFMSNPTEDKLMQTEAYQNKLALGMANGIDLFLGR